MKEKTILHVDVNNFFASVECVNNPKLSGKAVAVTGNPKKRNGIILAKNEIAKSFGVKTGEAIWQAQQKCPNLVTVGPHYELYEKISKQLQNLYLNYTDFIEPLGLDECWLDVTGSLKYLNKSGSQIADEIREKVYKHFHFTVSIGVSFSKIFAKLGSDLKKPNATTVISKENFKKLTYPLPLNSIIGIGNKLNKKFEKMNILTIGEFVALPESYINQTLNKTGRELYAKLKGELDEPVTNYFSLALPKSIGNGTTTVIDIIDRKDVEKVLKFLSEKIALRMSNANLSASTISVTLKTNDFKRFSHSKTHNYFRSQEEIFNYAKNLVNIFWDYSSPLRAIRVRVSNLKSIAKMEQLSIFNQKELNLTESLQKIKNLYGKDKIFMASDTASFINRKNKDEEL